MIGLYVHVPYCVRKCGYCDFYSVCDMSSADKYTDAVCARLDSVSDTSDTLYIGGGTPSLLGAQRIGKIVSCAKRVLTEDAEITVEVNPGDNLTELLPKLADCGVNRVSIGMQSYCDDELRLLTRRHSAKDVDNAVRAARSSGIENISLDVMLGIEGQTPRSLNKTLNYCADSGATHVSAYMLKIERGTPFSKKGRYVPDDDLQADLYLQTVETLHKLGFEQYEISNFCKNGRRSRHNMKYWLDEEYIGIGPAAHSYYKGMRFYYPRDINGFIEGQGPISDGVGGEYDEYVMLRLRLTDGLDTAKLNRLYPKDEKRTEKLIEKAKLLSDKGLIVLNNGIVSLTVEGFLVSNSVILELIG